MKTQTAPFSIGPSHKIFLNNSTELAPTPPTRLIIPCMKVKVREINQNKPWYKRLSH